MTTRSNETVPHTLRASAGPCRPASTPERRHGIESPVLAFGVRTGELHLDEDLVDRYLRRLDEIFRETCHGRLELRALS